MWEFFLFYFRTARRLSIYSYFQVNIPHLLYGTVLCPESLVQLLIHPIGCMRSPHLESTLKAETIVSGYSDGRTTAKIAMIAFNYQLVTDLSKGRRVDEAVKSLHTPGYQQQAITLLSKIAVNRNHNLIAICFGRAW